MYGEIAYEVITKVYNGTVEAVVDNKYSKVQWFDKACIRSAELRQYSSVDLIICASNSFQMIVKETETLENDVHVFDMGKILEDYRLLYNSNDAIKMKSLYLYGDIDLDELIQRYNYYAGEDNGYQHKIYFFYCMMCITSKCSLKCKNCAAFITKYKTPYDYSLEYVKTNFGKILDVIDGINELEIMGGESFLHTNFDDILEWCIEQKKVHAIKIVTNGTIIPREKTWGIMKHNKVKLVIDDYKGLSRNYAEIVRLAKEHGVRYEEQKLQIWYQLEPVSKKNLSKDERKTTYQNCNFRSCIGMINGRFYHCNVAGHMNASGLLSDEESDYIQLEGKEWNPIELRERIKELLDIKSLKACDYCNYCSHIEIPVAEQIEE